MNKSFVAKQLVALAKNLLAAEARTISPKERAEYEKLIRDFDTNLSNLGFNGDWNKEFNGIENGKSFIYNLNISQISTPSASAISKSPVYSFTISKTKGQGGHGGILMARQEFKCDTIDKLKGKLNDVIKSLEKMK